MLADILKSRLFIVSGLVLLVLTGFFLGKELRKKYQVNRELRLLQEEIATLERRNRETLELISYFKTPEYKERQARTLLNLQKPGEFAVALPEANEPRVEQGDSGKTSQESNFKKWWDYFFSAKR